MTFLLPYFSVFNFFVQQRRRVRAFNCWCTHINAYGEETIIHLSYVGFFMIFISWFAHCLFCSSHSRHLKLINISRGALDNTAFLFTALHLQKKDQSGFCFQNLLTWGSQFNWKITSTLDNLPIKRIKPHFSFDCFMVINIIFIYIFPICPNTKTASALKLLWVFNNWA